MYSGACQKAAGEVVFAPRRCVKRRMECPLMSVTAGVIMFLMSAIVAIPCAIAAGAFAREPGVPTLGRVMLGALAVILVALPFALAVGAGQLVAWIMSLVG